MKKLTSLVFVLFFSVGRPAQAQQLQPDDLVGVYECVGKSPDGSPYEGFVEIVKIEDTYRVLWVINDRALLGVGIFSSGVFAAVGYIDDTPILVVYKVDGNRLVGEWVTTGLAEGGVYSEVLTKVPEGTVPAPPKPAPDPHVGSKV